MKVSELEEKVSLINLIAKDYKIKKEGKTLRVNPCPVCGSKDHFTIDENKNYYSSFNGCCTGGSVYKYLQEVKGMDEDQAYKELKSLAGDTTEYKKNITQSTPHKEIEKVIPLKNYTNTIVELYNKQTDQDKAYFINRGLTHEIIEKYKLCIGDIGKGRRAIIPIWKDGQVTFYNSRSLTEQKPKYMKAPGNATFLNIDYLKTATKGEIIIICESEFDSLSLEAIGIKSIAIGGTQYVDIMLKEIEGIKNKGLIFLTAFDNDAAGIEATNKMNFNILEVAAEHKDMNEWLICNRGDFKANISQQVQIVRDMASEAIRNEIKEYKGMTNASSYIKAFIGGINESVNTPAIPTGFKNMDRVLDDGLYEGLYIIGAISSLGKTSWLLQVCDQIAQQGQDILYFSLEMSRAELMAKSISRLTFINANNKHQAKTTRGIMSGKRWEGYNSTERELIADSIQKYSTYADNLYISEGLGTIGVKEIEAAVERHINITGNKPVVVIDYLQIIASYDIRATDKQNVDNAVFQLKRISREYKIPVVAISSLNRASYKEEISMSAFKESGAVEYSSDVLLGLQFQKQNDDKFNVDEEKSKEKREIEVKVLKNRNGATGGTIKFDYYCLFNYFVETGMKEIIPRVKKVEKR